MPNWLDENTIAGEMSEDDFIKEVTKLMRARVEKEEHEGIPRNYGNDGMITIYEENKTHAGVAYQLKALRYFAVCRLPEGLFELRNGGMNKIGKHVVVESEGPGPSYELRQLLGLDDFLYHDTLHSGQEDWTLKQQWEDADNLAKEDCDRVSQLEAAFNHKVKQLRRELKAWIRGLEQ